MLEGEFILYRHSTLPYAVSSDHLLYWLFLISIKLSGNEPTTISASRSDTYIVQNTYQFDIDNHSEPLSMVQL